MSSRLKSKEAGDLGPLARLLLCLLTLWSLAMIVPGLQRVFDSLSSFGLSANNDGVITDVVTPFRSPAESPAANAGIHPGDRVDLQAMNCSLLETRQCAGLDAILGGLGGAQFALPHSQINLAIDPAAGRPARAIDLLSAPAPVTLPGRVVLFADTAMGCIVVVIAFWLVWTRPCWMTWGLFLYVIWINPGQSDTYYALLQRFPVAVIAQEVAEALAQGAAFAGLALFALRFPEDRTEPRWKWAQWLLLPLAIGLAVLGLLSFSNLVGRPTEKISEIGFLLGYAIDAAVLLILFERRRHLPPHEEQRMRWVIWGCVIGLPTYIFAELCQSSDLVRQLWGIAPSQVLIGLLYLPNGVLAYFASQAVWQRRVVSVLIPLRHGTILAALSMAMGVPIFLLHEKLSLLPEHFRMPGWVWFLVIVPVLLLLLDRLHEISVDLVDHAFNRNFHSVQRRLESGRDAMLRAGSLAEIDCLLVESAVDALCLASGAVFRSDGMVLRRNEETKGWTATMKRELRPQSDAIALRSLQVGVPVRMVEADWDSPELPAGLEAPCLSVPIRSEVPEATGVALFGPHETGNDVNADEREMLDRLAEWAASGYERVTIRVLHRQVEQLKAQLAAMQSAVPVAAGDVLQADNRVDPE